jgi:DNA-binding XRE family transcriptional regulator
MVTARHIWRVGQRRTILEKSRSRASSETAIQIRGVSLHFRQPLVGQRLRELREQLGLTRAELSALTGVTTSAIVRFESGLDVRLSSYLPIVQYFGSRQPLSWALAEWLTLLPAERLAEIRALLDVGDGADD